MQKRFINNLPPWEWITLMGVVCTTAVSATAYAFSKFENAGAAENVRQEIKKDVSRVERKIDALLLNRGLTPQKYESDE